MPNQHDTTTAIRHGENAGYQAHYRLGVPINDLDSCGCRAAHAKYNSDKRGGIPKLVTKNKERDLIRSRAFRKLAKQFPREFMMAVQKETEIRRRELLKRESEVDDKARGW